MAAGYPSWMTLASRLVARLLDLPPARTRDLVIDRDLQVRTPDGVVLLADRYSPRNSSRLPTVLVRSPYGRRGVFGALFATPFAERGFQVLIQSCRGTFGSGGHMDPFANERADGLATVAWLKEQPWYSGELAMIGLSYLGFVQWAIASEIGDDLKAMVPQVTTSEFRGQTYAGESFTLDTALSWTYMMAYQEKSALEVLVKRIATNRTLERVFKQLPLGEAELPALAGVERRPPALRQEPRHRRAARHGDPARRCLTGRLSRRRAALGDRALGPALTGEGASQRRRRGLDGFAGLTEHQ